MSFPAARGSSPGFMPSPQHANSARNHNHHHNGHSSSPAAAAPSSSSHFPYAVTRDSRVFGLSARYGGTLGEVVQNTAQKASIGANTRSTSNRNRSESKESEDPFYPQHQQRQGSGALNSNNSNNKPPVIIESPATYLRGMRQQQQQQYPQQQQRQQRFTSNAFSNSNNVPSTNTNNHNSATSTNTIAGFAAYEAQLQRSLDRMQREVEQQEAARREERLAEEAEQKRIRYQQQYDKIFNNSNSNGGNGLYYSNSGGGKEAAAGEATANIDYPSNMYSDLRFFAGYRDEPPRRIANSDNGGGNGLNDDGNANNDGSSALVVSSIGGDDKSYNNNTMVMVPASNNNNSSLAPSTAGGPLVRGPNLATLPVHEYWLEHKAVLQQEILWQREEMLKEISRADAEILLQTNILREKAGKELEFVREDGREIVDNLVKLEKQAWKAVKRRELHIFQIQSDFNEVMANMVNRFVEREFEIAARESALRQRRFQVEAWAARLHGEMMVREVNIARISREAQRDVNLLSRREMDAAKTQLKNLRGFDRAVLGKKQHVLDLDGQKDPANIVLGRIEIDNYHVSNSNENEKDNGNGKSENPFIRMISGAPFTITGRIVPQKFFRRKLVEKEGPPAVEGSNDNTVEVADDTASVAETSHSTRSARGRAKSSGVRGGRGGGGPKGGTTTPRGSSAGATNQQQRRGNTPNNTTSGNSPSANTPSSRLFASNPTTPAVKQNSAEVASSAPPPTYTFEELTTDVSQLEGMPICITYSEGSGGRVGGTVCAIVDHEGRFTFSSVSLTPATGSSSTGTKKDKINQPNKDREEKLKRRISVGASTTTSNPLIADVLSTASRSAKNSSGEKGDAATTMMVFSGTSHRLLISIPKTNAGIIQPKTITLSMKAKYLTVPRRRFLAFNGGDEQRKMLMAIAAKMKDSNDTAGEEAKSSSSISNKADKATSCATSAVAATDDVNQQLVKIINFTAGGEWEPSICRLNGQLTFHPIEPFGLFGVEIEAQLRFTAIQDNDALDSAVTDGEKERTRDAHLSSSSDVIPATATREDEKTNKAGNHQDRSNGSPLNEQHRNEKSALASQSGRSSVLEGSFTLHPSPNEPASPTAPKQQEADVEGIAVAAENEATDNKAEDEGEKDNSIERPFDLTTRFTLFGNELNQFPFSINMLGVDGCPSTFADLIQPSRKRHVGFLQKDGDVEVAESMTKPQFTRIFMKIKVPATNYSDAFEHEFEINTLEIASEHPYFIYDAGSIGSEMADGGEKCPTAIAQPPTASSTGAAVIDSSKPFITTAVMTVDAEGNIVDNDETATKQPSQPQQKQQQETSSTNAKEEIEALKRQLEAQAREREHQLELKSRETEREIAFAKAKAAAEATEKARIAKEKEDEAFAAVEKGKAQLKAAADAIQKEREALENLRLALQKEMAEAKAKEEERKETVEKSTHERQEKDGGEKQIAFDDGDLDQEQQRRQRQAEAEAADAEAASHGANVPRRKSPVVPLRTGSNTLLKRTPSLPGGGGASRGATVSPSPSPSPYGSPTLREQQALPVTSTAEEQDAAVVEDKEEEADTPSYPTSKVTARSTVASDDNAAEAAKADALSPQDLAVAGVATGQGQQVSDEAYLDFRAINVPLHDVTIGSRLSTDGNLLAVVDARGTLRIYTKKAAASKMAAMREGSPKSLAAASAIANTEADSRQATTTTTPRADNADTTANADSPPRQPSMRFGLAASVNQPNNAKKEDSPDSIMVFGDASSPLRLDATQNQKQKQTTTVKPIRSVRSKLKKSTPPPPIPSQYLASHYYWSEVVAVAPIDGQPFSGVMAWAPMTTPWPWRGEAPTEEEKKTKSSNSDATTTFSDKTPFPPEARIAVYHPHSQMVYSWQLNELKQLYDAVRKAFAEQQQQMGDSHSHRNSPSSSPKRSPRSKNGSRHNTPNRPSSGRGGAHHQHSQHHKQHSSVSASSSRGTGPLLLSTCDPIAQKLSMPDVYRIDTMGSAYNANTPNRSYKAHNGSDGRGSHRQTPTKNRNNSSAKRYDPIDLTPLPNSAHAQSSNTDTSPQRWPTGKNGDNASTSNDDENGSHQPADVGIGGGSVDKPRGKGYESPTMTCVTSRHSTPNRVASTLQTRQQHLGLNTNTNNAAVAPEGVGMLSSKRSFSTLLVGPDVIDRAAVVFEAQFVSTTEIVLLTRKGHLYDGVFGGSNHNNSENSSDELSAGFEIATPSPIPNLKLVFDETARVAGIKALGDEQMTDSNDKPLRATCLAAVPAISSDLVFIGYSDMSLIAVSLSQQQKQQKADKGLVSKVSSGTSTTDSCCKLLFRMPPPAMTLAETASINLAASLSATTNKRTSAAARHNASNKNKNNNNNNNNNKANVGATDADAVEKALLESEGESTTPLRFFGSSPYGPFLYFAHAFGVVMVKVMINTALSAAAAAAATTTDDGTSINTSSSPFHIVATHYSADEIAIGDPEGGDIAKLFAVVPIHKSLAALLYDTNDCFLVDFGFLRPTSNKPTVAEEEEENSQNNIEQTNRFIVYAAVLGAEDPDVAIQSSMDFSKTVVMPQVAMDTSLVLGVDAMGPLCWQITLTK